MRSISHPVLCVLFLFSVAQADAPPALPDAPDPQTLADRALHLLDPSHAPTCQGPHPATCGTATLMAVRAAWNDLPEKTRGRLALLLQQQARPSTQAEYISASGRFRIHYDTSGLHGVSTTDLNRNGVPDYVDEVGITADSARSTQVGRFGFKPPPSDGTVGGGRDQYDIYVRELSRQSAYGYTYPENTAATTSTSYLEIDNNYTDSIYASKEKDGLHTTIAHEFFHAVQFGYYSLFDAQWWQETTAVWMEDVAYTEVNDYYQYLSSFFNAPTTSLDRFLPFGDLHPFGSAVFIHKLYALFGVAPIRAGWENLGVKKDWKIDYIDEVLPGGFDQGFPRFVVWNYFTRTRTRPGYYPEASAYPLVRTRSLSARPGVILADSGRVDHLAADYLLFQPAKQSGGLSVNLTLAPGARWKTLALLIQPGGAQIVEGEGGQFRIPDWGQYDEIAVIPVCLSLTGSAFTYRVTAEVRSDILKPARVVGDFNGDGGVDFTDFFAFVEAFGKPPSAAGFDPRYDLNGDGGVDFTDFFTFAAHFGEKGG